MKKKRVPTSEELAKVVESFPLPEVEIQFNDNPGRKPVVHSKTKLAAMLRTANLNEKGRREIHEALLESLSKKIDQKESILKAAKDSIGFLTSGYEARKSPGKEPHKTYAERLLREARIQFGHTDADIERLLQPVMMRMCMYSEALTEEGEEFSIERFESLKNKVGPFAIGTTLWAQAGYPDFDLPTDFFHSIAATDFGDAGGEELNLPFPAFCLRLPENEIMGGARVIFVFKFDGNFVRNEQTGSLESEGDAVFTIGDGRLMCLIFNAPSYEVGDSQAVVWQSSVTMDSILNKAPKIPDEAKSLRNWEELAEMSILARRILVNTMIYINANGGPPEKGQKKIGPEVAVERDHKSLPRFRVGRPVKLGPTIRKMLYQRNPSSESRELMSRFMVRGHWRNQAHGPQMALRKRMWIEPYWKGPETVTEALKRTYEVA